MSGNHHHHLISLYGLSSSACLKTISFSICFGVSVPLNLETYQRSDFVFLKKPTGSTMEALFPLKGLRVSPKNANFNLPEQSILWSANTYKRILVLPLLIAVSSNGYTASFVPNRRINGAASPSIITFLRFVSVFLLTFAVTKHQSFFTY